MAPFEKFIENRTFDEIRVGESASMERRLTMDDIKLFAVMSGDVNPAHVDEDYAKSSRFQQIIAHGMWGGAMARWPSTMRSPRPPHMPRASSPRSRAAPTSWWHRTSRWPT